MKINLIMIKKITKQYLNYNHPGLDPGRNHIIPKKYFEALDLKKNAATQKN